MRTKFDITNYTNVNVSSYPDVHSFREVLDRSLWVLLVSSEKLSYQYLSAYQIYKVLTDVYSISVTQEGIKWALLHKGKKLIHKKKTRKAILFSIMEAGKRYICQSGQKNVTLIVPEKAYSGLQEVKDIFNKLEGEIYICDPIIDSKTITLLRYINKKYNIKLLTQKINDSSVLKREYTAYKKEYGNLEIRVAQQRDVHDRYIISKKGLLLIGTSLNYLGNKLAFIVNLGEHEIKREVEKHFNNKWANATVFG